MKRFIYIIVVFCFLFLNACDKNDLVSIQVKDFSNNSEFINEFNIEDYKLVLYYENGKVEYVNVNLNMLNSEDVSKLTEEGKHTITLNYFDVETNISFTIIEEDLKYRFDYFKENLNGGYVYDSSYDFNSRTKIEFNYDDYEFPVFEGFAITNEYQYYNDNGVEVYNIYYDRCSYNFLIYDGDRLLYEDTFMYEENIVFDYAPFKSNYEFIGYDIEVPTKMGSKNIVLNANFNPIKFTYKFIDYDGTVLKEETLIKNSEIVAPDNPVREADAVYNYQFINWSNYVEGMKLTKNIVFTAEYLSVFNKYNVIFKNVDGTVLETKVVQYGENAYYTGVMPVHPYNPQYNYTFIGWDKELNYVINNLEVFAVYDKVETKILVNIEIDGINTIKYVEYGSDVNLPTNPEKYGHTFIGWNHSGKNITKPITIKAMFVTNNYNVNYYIDGVKYKTIPMKYDELIDLSDPVIDKDYIFTGWNSIYERVPGFDYDVHGHILDVKDFNEPYSGNEKNVRYSSKLNVVDLKYKVSDYYVDSAINAGAYLLELKYLENNGVQYTFSYGLTIKKADSIIKADDLYVTYDGSIHNIKYELNHSESGIVTDCFGVINAGEYDVTLYVEESENYNSATITKKIIINKALYDMSKVSFPNASYTYDGQEKVVEIFGVLPSGLSVVYLNNKLTNAGAITATAIFEGDFENYEIVANVNCELTVKPKKAVITIDNKSSIYGKELEEFSYSYSGFIEDVNLEIIKEEGLIVGSYKLTTTYLDNNYDITIIDGVYTINKATYDLSEITFDNQTLVYDGSERTITISGELPSGLTAVYTNNKITNAGTIYPIVSFVGDFENYYEVNNMECIVNVEKKNATITINNISSVYGEELLPFTYEPRGIYSRDQVEVIITKEEGLEVGEYALIGSASHPNYNFTIVNGVYRIALADFIGLEFNNKTVIYDGNSHSIEVKGLTDELTVEYQNNRVINAGNHEVTAVVSSSNYNEVILKAILTIEKKDAKIIIDNKESVYKESLVDFTYSTDGFIEEIDVTILKEEGLIAGNYRLYTDYTNDNYNITIIEGKYQIKKAESVIEMVSLDDTYVYTGDKIILSAKINHNESNLVYTNNEMVEPGIYTLLVECPESDNYLSARLTFNYSIKYAVNFYDANGEVIYTSLVLNGGNAKFEGDLPKKASDLDCYYEFDSWNKEYINVTSNLDIYPVYIKTDILYNIIYKDNNNNTLLSYSNIKYGETVEEPGKVLRTSNNRNKAYIFNMWEVLNYSNSTDNFDGTRTLILKPIYLEVDSVAVIDNKYYGSITDAINDSKNGDLITLLYSSINSSVINEDCVLKEGVTLYLPYAEGIDISNANGNGEGGTFSISKKYIDLSINNSTLTVLGNIVVGAVTGYNGYNGSNYLQGSINGAYSQINLGNDSHLVVGDGSLESSITCYGIIEDSSVGIKSSITVNNNATVSENFVIYDWKGGTYLLNNFYVNKKVSPFNRYQLPYIKPEIKFVSGSKYKGIGKVFVSLDGTESSFTSMPFMIIGSELNESSGKTANGLFTLLDSDGYVIKKFNDANNVAVNSYTDKLSFYITGKAKINSLSIVFNNSLYSTEYVSFPIPYGLEINLINCDLEINNLFKVLPGGEINIDENSSLTIRDYDTTDSYLAGLSIYDNYNYADAPADVYPSVNQLSANGLSTSGVLINNGSFIIDSNETWVGGKVTGTGKIIKNYQGNKGKKGEIPTATSTSYKETYLDLYFNGKLINRSYSGVYE